MRVLVTGMGGEIGVRVTNLLERDRMLTDRLFEETQRLKLPVIEIDTPMTEGELARQLTQVFGL